MQRLQMSAKVILTDSGGMQKEAYFHRVPCVTLRDETEWIETVETGWNQLVGVDENAIVRTAKSIKPTTTTQTSIFGDGYAVEKVIKAIAD